MFGLIRSDNSRLFFMAATMAGSQARAQPVVNDLGLLPASVDFGLSVNTQHQQVVAKGLGSSLLVWTDMRARSVSSQAVQGDGEIFGVRVGDDGVALDPTPFRIAGGMGLQQSPVVGWNGEGWLVVFSSQDPVGGYFEDRIRAVRVSASGVVLDTTPLVLPEPALSAGTIGLNVGGQQGQWIVTRCVYHSNGYGTFVGGYRVDNSGVVLDPSPLMLSDWIYGGTRIVPVGGEYLVVGPDWNNSSVSRAQRISQNGEQLGAGFDVKSPWIGSDGSECYIAWVSGFTDLVGSRMSINGVLSTPGGTPLAPGFVGLSHVNIDHDSTRWWVEYGVADLLKTIRVSQSGQVLDPGGGVTIPVMSGGSIANTPVMAAAPAGGVRVYWNDSRSSLGNDTNVFGIGVNASNVPGSETGYSTGSLNHPSVELTGVGAGYAAAYVEERANDRRVMLARLDAGGALIGKPIEIGQAPVIGQCGVAWNGLHYTITWDVGSPGLTPVQIVSRRVAADGTFIDPSPVTVMQGFSPAIGALGDDILITGHKFGSSPQFIDLLGRRFDGQSGNPHDPSPIYLAGSYVTGSTRVRSDGKQWLVTSSSQWCHNCSQSDALLVKVPPSGAPAPAFNPTTTSGGAGDLDIAYSGSNYLLVWRSNTLSNANNYISGRVVNADGSYLTGDFTIAEAAGRQLQPAVAWDGESYVVVWDDQRNQQSFFDARTDVYGARVSLFGDVLDPIGFPVKTSPEGDVGARIASSGGGASLVAFSTFTLTPPLDSYRIGLGLIGDYCYADCDGSGSLDFFDFLCFQNEFSAGASYADCDGSGSLDFFDFLCFQNAFAAGCP